MGKTLLNISNLKASVTETEEKILDGLNLSIGKGETHAIMGPNGGGKSTLVNVIAGKDSYTVDSGKIEYLVTNEFFQGVIPQLLNIFCGAEFFK